MTALAALPAADDQVKLHVAQADGRVELKLTGAEYLDFDRAEIFPLTEQVLDPNKAIYWKKAGNGYVARVKKSQSAAKELTQLTLVIAPGTLQCALRIEWTDQVEQ